MGDVELRPEVARFAQAMELTLRRHDAVKGSTGWKSAQSRDLLDLLGTELRELRRVVARGDAPTRVLAEATDVANLAMMVADVCSALEQRSLDLGGAWANQPPPLPAPREPVRSELESRGGTATEIVDTCNEVRDLLLRKNAAYGNSALDPVRVFSRADRLEQLRVRIDDKLSRLARGRGDDEDTELDLIGYLLLLRAARRIDSRRPAPGTAAGRGTSVDDPPPVNPAPSGPTGPAASPSSEAAP